MVADLQHEPASPIQQLQQQQQQQQLQAGYRQGTHPLRAVHNLVCTVQYANREHVWSDMMYIVQFF